MRVLNHQELTIVSGGYDPNEVDEIVVVAPRRDEDFLQRISESFDRFATAAEIKANEALAAAQAKVDGALNRFSSLITSNSNSPILNPNTCDPSDPNDSDCDRPFPRIPKS